MAGKKEQLSLVVKAIDSFSGPLRAMTAKVNALTAPVKGLGKDFKGFGEALNLGGLMQGFSGVGGALKNVAGEVFSLGAKLAALAAGGGAAIYSLVHSAMEFGDELATMADRVGLGVDAYASLRYAAAQADVEQEEFNTAMDKFNKNLGEMTVGNGGEFLAFLNKVSPALAKQMKAAHGTEEALSLMTDAFKRIDDPAKSAALSAAAFGKSGLQMGRWLHSGSPAIQKAQRRFMELAGSQAASAAAASDLDNAAKDTATAMLGLRQAVGGALFPAFTQLANALTGFMVKNRDGLKKWAEGAGKAISAWLAGGGLDRLVQRLSDVGSAVGKVINFLGPMGTAFVVGGVLAAPLIGSLFGLAGAAINLGVAVWPLITSLTSLGPLLPILAEGFAGVTFTVLPFVAAAASLAWAGKTIYDNWDQLAFLFQNFGETVKITWKAIEPIGKAIANPIGALYDHFKAPEVDPMDAVVQQATDKQRAYLALNAARALPSGMARQTNDARVTVNFSSMPPGARVSVDPNSSASVDTSVGYSSVAP